MSAGALSGSLLPGPRRLRSPGPFQPSRLGHTVDADHCAGHIAGKVAGQEQKHVGHLLRLPDPPQGNRRRPPQIAYETQEDQVAAGLAAHGFGIAIVPYMDLLLQLN